TTQRPRGVPEATAPIPVANASASARNSIRLVRRPDRARTVASPRHNNRYSDCYRPLPAPPAIDASTPLDKAGVQRIGRACFISLRPAGLGAYGEMISCVYERVIRSRCNPRDPSLEPEHTMIVLGVILLLLGIFLQVPILTTIGIIALVIG